MSKQTKQQPPDGKKLMDFLRRAAERVGWKTNVGQRQGTVWLQAYTGLGQDSRPEYVQIELTGHNTAPLFLVSRFHVGGGARTLLSGDDLLAHFGKIVADTEKTDALVQNDLSSFWTVSCPRDVEAMLRAYDSLASFQGRPTLFNLS